MSQRFKANDEDDINVEESNVVIGKKENDSNKGKKGSLLFGNCSCKRAKKVVASPFNKLYKRYKVSSSCSSDSHRFPMLSLSSTRNDSYFSCLCMSKPPTLDSDFEGIDPCDPKFSSLYVKSLIEKNDFYSKECNAHFPD